MAVIVEDGRLTLTGFVGEPTTEFWNGEKFEGFTYEEVVTALAEYAPDEALVVQINSGGGYATEGTAIRSALADRDGQTDIIIAGIAASAASIIAMAGNSIAMSLGSLLMIHDPSGFTWGTVQDHEKSIRGLNALGNTYARVYARKSGKTDEECRTIMRDETWYTPDEAVAAGFADDALDDAATAVAAFPYQQYSHAPGELVAMAKTNGWRTPVPVAASAKRPEPKPKARKKEKPEMALKPKASGKPAATSTPAEPAEAVTAEDVKARIKAITGDEAAKGHEALAQHLAFETDIPEAEAIATLKAAATDAPVKDPETPDPKGYQARRTAAADLAQPGTGTGEPPKTAALSDAVARTNKRR